MKKELFSPEREEAERRIAQFMEHRGLSVFARGALVALNLVAVTLGAIALLSIGRLLGLL